MSLLTEWAAFDPKEPPYLLDGDEALAEHAHVVITSEQQLIRHPGFDFTSTSTLHLGLLPVPFAGDLNAADIYILLQNPGFLPSDYFAEFRDAALVAATKANLKQELGASDYPFFYLDPQFSYHGGFGYWRRKLSPILAGLMRRDGLSLVDALQVLAKRLAIVEFFPYHSSTGSFKDSVLRRLRSVGLARQFVHDVLVPRAARREALVVVTRKARLWGLRADSGVVVYAGPESLGASLGFGSPGGKAIAQRLGLDVRA